jgi:hypothetical protein
VCNVNHPGKYVGSFEGNKEGMYNTVQHPNKKQIVMNTVYQRCKDAGYLPKCADGLFKMADQTVDCGQERVGSESSGLGCWPDLYSAEPT